MINENDLYRVVSAIEEAVNNDSGIDLTYRLNGKSGNETVWVNFQGRKAAGRRRSSDHTWRYPQSFAGVAALCGLAQRNGSNHVCC